MFECYLCLMTAEYSLKLKHTVAVDDEADCYDDENDVDDDDDVVAAGENDRL
jgi:hypothetical protein